VHPEDLARVITDSGRILAHERIVHEYRFLRRGGRVVRINDELHLLRNVTKQPSEVVGAWTDRAMPVMDGPAFIRVLRRLNPLTWGCRTKPACPNRSAGPCCCRPCSACSIRKPRRNIERSELPGSADDDWLQFAFRQAKARTEPAGKLKSCRQSPRLICNSGSADVSLACRVATTCRRDAGAPRGKNDGGACGAASLLDKPALFLKLDAMSSASQPLVIAGRVFRSRLIMGTGKFSSPEAMRDALAASGAEMVTVALRRADLSGQRDPFANILEFIDSKKFLLLPNTSGAMNAEEAVRLARLAAAAGLPKWVKLEIHPDPRYLLPDPVETFKAADILVKDGFTVLPYINADPVLAKRLQDVGVATVMPLGSPIGSNRGIQTRDQIRIIIEVNTAVAVSSDPNRMAIAFKMAVEAGRAAFEAGLGATQETASATSPLTAFLD
jgi:thiazole synthase